MRARGMTDDIAGRMAAQASDEQRRAAADVWLDNSGTAGDLRALVDALWRERLVPFEHNVRHGIRSRRPEALRLCAGDPTGPPSPAARRAGGPCLRCDRRERRPRREHSGAGLPAKDVIDLQVAVTSLADVDEPGWSSGCRRLGSPGCPHRRDNSRTASRGPSASTAAATLPAWPTSMCAERAARGGAGR